MERNAELLDARGLARELGVSVGTVNRWARAVRIPVLRLSRKVRRFRLPDVVDAIRTRNAEEGRRDA